MKADKFGSEYAQFADAVVVMVDQEFDERAVVNEALREAWSVFDKLGSHQSDEQRIAVIHSPEFASAAFRVRTAMLRVARQI